MMTPTSPVTNPTSPPGGITANTQCGCAGDCGTHTGQCPAQHGHRHPTTRTLIHLQTTPGGPRCPYCHLAKTRPGATSPTTAAALNRPTADADQDDLFDITAFERPGRRAGGR